MTDADFSGMLLSFGQVLAGLWAALASGFAYCLHAVGETHRDLEPYLFKKDEVLTLLDTIQRIPDRYKGFLSKEGTEAWEDAWDIIKKRGNDGKYKLERLGERVRNRWWVYPAQFEGIGMATFLQNYDPAQTDAGTIKVNSKHLYDYARARAAGAIYSDCKRQSQRVLLKLMFLSSAGIVSLLLCFYPPLWEMSASFGFSRDHAGLFFVLSSLAAVVLGAYSLWREFADFTERRRAIAQKTT